MDQRLAFNGCYNTLLTSDMDYKVCFFSCPSVQALAMVLFISSSPSSYIFFIIFIRLALGSALSSILGSSAFFLLSAAIFSAKVTWLQSLPGLCLARKRRR